MAQRSKMSLVARWSRQLFAASAALWLLSCTGEPGPQGSVGSSGPTGPQGTPGPQGVPGPTGAPGATGEKGQVGAVGPTGPAGIDGAPGVPGPTGATGPAGLIGPTGPTGATGATGPLPAVQIAGGLTGTGDPGSPLAVSFGGSGSATTVARSDHSHTPLIQTGVVNPGAALELVHNLGTTDLAVTVWTQVGGEWELLPGTGVANLPDLVLRFGFEEGTGSAVTDLSGNGNTGAFTGAAAWTSGQQGGGVAVDGAASTGVTAADSPSLTFSNALTVAAWIKPADCSHGTSGHNTVVAKDSEFLLAFDNTCGIANYVSTNVGGWTGDFPGTKVAVNTWSHLAVTYDGSTIRSYLNGVLQSAGTAKNGTVNNTTVAAYVGRRPDCCTQTFNGVIDDVAVFKRALSAPELSTLMAGARGAKVSLPDGNRVRVTNQSSTQLTIKVVVTR